MFSSSCFSRSVCCHYSIVERSAKRRFQKLLLNVLLRIGGISPPWRKQLAPSSSISLPLKLSNPQRRDPQAHLVARLLSRILGNGFSGNLFREVPFVSRVSVLGLSSNPTALSSRIITSWPTLKKSSSNSRTIESLKDASSAQTPRPISQ